MTIESDGNNSKKNKRNKYTKMHKMLTIIIHKKE